MCVAVSGSTTHLGSNLKAVVQNAHVKRLSHFNLHLVRMEAFGGITHMKSRIPDCTIERSIQSVDLAVLVDRFSDWSEMFSLISLILSIGTTALIVTLRFIVHFICELI